MAFCVKENQLITDGMTVIDNKFIFNYACDAPAVAVNVYLLGLALSDSDTENTQETIAKRLNITTNEVIEAFYYWEELGLVHITASQPVQVAYLPVRSSASILKKVKSSKYAKFSREIQFVLSGRMINPAEYSEYYLFLENTLFAPEALLAVAKYCVELRGNDINFKYILAVARNLLQKGVTTLEACEDSLNSQSKYDNDLRLLLKAMKIKRPVDHEDRALYEKWTKDLGFSLDTLISVAKSTKRSSLKHLDLQCSEYFRNGVVTSDAIADYQGRKDIMFDIAKKITNGIGVYYQSLDTVVDEYVCKWVQKGYDEQTLSAVAKYCFRSGIRTLRGLSDIIDKLFKMGLVSFESINAYIYSVAQLDKRILQILVKCGLERNVTPADRQFYKVWTENWSMTDGIIDFAAVAAVGTSNPMQYVNKILLNCKAQSIFTAEQALLRNAAVAATVAKGSDSKKTVSFAQHEYTDAELQAMFTSLENLEL